MPSQACRSSWSGLRQPTAGASPAPITIAYITDLTGEGASENGTSPAGFEARLDLQNAEGGVNGHKLVPLVIDDQTSPSEYETAVQEADSKALGIVSQSPLFFLAAKYPQETGVPVTGTYDDGPEWGTQPYTNMFASGTGQRGPEVPGKHIGSEHPEGTWGHGSWRLRLRHLADVEPLCDRRRGCLPARGPQGGRAEHDDSVRQCRLHQRHAESPSRTTSTRWYRRSTTTRTSRWPKR